MRFCVIIWSVFVKTSLKLKIYPFLPPKNITPPRSVWYHKMSYYYYCISHNDYRIITELRITDVSLRRQFIPRRFVPVTISFVSADRSPWQKAFETWLKISYLNIWTRWQLRTKPISPLPYVSHSESATTGVNLGLDLGLACTDDNCASSCIPFFKTS